MLGLGRGHLVSSTATPIESGGGGGGVTARERRQRCGRARGARTIAWARTSVVLLLVGDPSPWIGGSGRGKDNRAGAHGEVELSVVGPSPSRHGVAAAASASVDVVLDEGKCDGESDGGRGRALLFGDSSSGLLLLGTAVAWASDGEGCFLCT